MGLRREGGREHRDVERYFIYNDVMNMIQMFELFNLIFVSYNFVFPLYFK